MSHDSGRSAHARRAQGQESSDHAGIGAGILQGLVAASVVSMEAGVGDVAEWFGREAADFGKNLAGESACAGVNNESSLVASLHNDVRAIADQHVNVVADRQDVDFSVVGIGVDRNASGGRSGRWTGQFTSFGVRDRGEFGFEFAVQRIGTAERPDQWYLVLLGILIEIGVRAK